MFAHCFKSQQIKSNNIVRAEDGGGRHSHNMDGWMPSCTVKAERQRNGPQVLKMIAMEVNNAVAFRYHLRGA